MNGFLLVYCTSIDDLPVALFATLAEAQSAAASAGLDGLRDAATDLLDRDSADPVCVRVIEFAGGLPVHDHYVRDLD